MEHRCVDKYLWDYKANVAAIDYLRQEMSTLMSVQGQRYEHQQGTMAVSEPVANVVQRKMELELKIQHLESRVQPVARLYDDLSVTDLAEAQMREILKLRFFDHESRNIVIRKMSISDATYVRRCKTLKRRAMAYFGEQ